MWDGLAFFWKCVRRISMVKSVVPPYLYNRKKERKEYMCDFIFSRVVFVNARIMRNVLNLFTIINQFLNKKVTCVTLKRQHVGRACFLQEMRVAFLHGQVCCSAISLQSKKKKSTFVISSFHRVFFVNTRIMINVLNFFTIIN